MESGLYVGEVVHVRLGARRHRLRYAVFQLLIDLDETRALDRCLRLLSIGRPNLFSHFDSDHGEGRSGALRAFVEEKLAEHGLSIDGGPIRLLAMPRVLGFVFNPLSIYFCHRPEGPLAAIVYEVNNTFGGRHWYVLPAGPDRIVRQHCAKAFHVSPFLAMNLTYDFEITPPGETVVARVTARNADGAPVIVTSFAGRRRELSDGVLLSQALALPLMTLKVVAGIHFEALRMLLKGIRSAPPPPAAAV